VLENRANTSPDFLSQMSSGNAAAAQEKYKKELKKF